MHPYSPYPSAPLVKEIETEAPSKEPKQPGSERKMEIEGLRLNAVAHTLKLDMAPESNSSMLGCGKVVRHPPKQPLQHARSLHRLVGIIPASKRYISSCCCETLGQKLHISYICPVINLLRALQECFGRF